MDIKKLDIKLAAVYAIIAFTVVVLGVAAGNIRDPHVKPETRLKDIKHVTNNLTSSIDKVYIGANTEIKSINFVDEKSGMIVLIDEFKVQFGSTYNNDREFRNLSNNLNELFSDNVNTDGGLVIQNIILEYDNVSTVLTPRYYQHTANSSEVMHSSILSTLKIDSRHKDFFKNKDEQTNLTKMIRYIAANKGSKKIYIDIVLKNDIIKCSFDDIDSINGSKLK